MFWAAVQNTAKLGRTLLSEQFPSITRSLCKMADNKLAAVPSVDIEEGVFKYILIKVWGPAKDGVEPHKLVVRGYKDCEWHCKLQ